MLLVAVTARLLRVRRYQTSRQVHLPPNRAKTLVDQKLQSRDRASIGLCNATKKKKASAASASESSDSGSDFTDLVSDDSGSDIDLSDLLSGESSRESFVAATKNKKTLTASASGSSEDGSAESNLQLSESASISGSKSSPKSTIGSSNEGKSYLDRLKELTGSDFLPKSVTNALDDRSATVRTRPPATSASESGSDSTSEAEITPAPTTKTDEEGSKYPTGFFGHMKSWWKNTFGGDKCDLNNRRLRLAQE
ncbi:hypothetical protein PPTG_07465 [Phytophthora nicotianae INRA-310]|uniref:Uncharacterized protein n=1 Tax=Phytophthora nicotianae (strain INRA-310) TaxID=761204 RepID=W2QN84_PHYN3|nr:hypothetical protein PPTG_07465 [Phytophthora nicotianae INRA-310]ETN14411.1 hypothetical protein PPTG_07465 [Phytophthora nicotianae INRA-310]